MGVPMTFLRDELDLWGRAQHSPWPGNSWGKTAAGVQRLLSGFAYLLKAPRQNRPKGKTYRGNRCCEWAQTQGSTDSCTTQQCSCKSRFRTDAAHTRPHLPRRTRRLARTSYSPFTFLSPPLLRDLDAPQRSARDPWLFEESKNVQTGERNQNCKLTEEKKQSDLWVCAILRGNG